MCGAVELDYARQISNMLKLRTYQLFFSWYPWPGEKAGARMKVLSDKQAALFKERQAALNVEGIPYRDALGRTYADVMLNLGFVIGYATRKDVVSQILSSATGSCASIVSEVGGTMITRPLLLRQLDYIEAPYSHGTIKSLRDNILSVRNVWYGSTDFLNSKVY